MKNDGDLKMSNEEKKELLERALQFISNSNVDKNGSSFLGAANYCYTTILEQLPGDKDAIEGLRKLAPMCIEENHLYVARFCYTTILEQLPGDKDAIEGLRNLATICINNDEPHYIGKWSLEHIIKQYSNCEENLVKFNDLYESCRLTKNFDKVISFIDNIIESNNKKKEYCMCNRCSECGKIIKEKLN